MSQIDSSMAPALRDKMLSEIQSLLPAFLSAASVERDGPIKAASELLGLPESDLRRVLAVHMMLSDPVRELLDELPSGLRRPLTASMRPRVVGRTVTSAIDWAATTRCRATSSPHGDIWVTRPANRIFDIPENRALAWVLSALEERAAVAVPATGDSTGAWRDEIRSMTGTLQRARRTAWLATIPSIWPGDDAYFRLKADRMGFYRSRITNVARYLRRILIAPTPGDIVEALSDRYFEPTQDWKLFEIAVLLRITQALAGVGTRVTGTRLFNDSRSRPFVSFRIGSIREVKLWYQTWPPETRPSELADALRYYDLPSGGNRPDIVAEIVDEGESVRAIILELKASASASYLSTGFAQLLGYLRDRPRLLSSAAAGWLVAPAGGGYTSKEPNGRALWVTTADDVGAAVKKVALTA